MNRTALAGVSLRMSAGPSARLAGRGDVYRGQGTRWRRARATSDGCHLSGERTSSIGKTVVQPFRGKIGDRRNGQRWAPFRRVVADEGGVEQAPELVDRQLD